MFRHGLIAVPGLLVLALPLAAQGPRSQTAEHSPSQRVHADSVIQAHNVRVLANNDEWTATGIHLKAGDCVMIFTEEGKVRVGPTLGEVDANGSASGRGLLKGKIGTQVVFAVGQRTTFCNPEPGNLKLKVSDTKYEDNSGEFRVLVIRVPGQFIPAPEDYTADD